MISILIVPVDGGFQAVALRAGSDLQFPASDVYETEDLVLEAVARGIYAGMRWGMSQWGVGQWGG